MSYIRRDDGVQFVMQSYRELLNVTQISALKREIRTLAKKQGENVCVFKRENGQFEIVFSRDPGFLLGESVWSYFGKPRNLIYCEALPDKENALMVIVKEGSVYFDAKVSYNELIEELVALSTSNEKYDIYTYGEVPLKEVAEKNQEKIYVLDKKLGNSFKSLPKSVFSSLLLNNSFQLLPVELALTSPHFKNKFIRPILLTATAAAIIFFIGHLLFSNKPSIPTKSAETEQKVFGPYELYNKDLSTPAPEKQLAEMNKIIVNFMALAGWTLDKLEYKDGTYTAQVKATPGGTNALLSQWAKIYGATTTSNNVVSDNIANSSNAQASTATLNISSKLTNRSTPKNIYNLDKALTILKNKIGLVLEKEDVKVLKTNSYEKTKSLDIEIGFKNFSPLTFDLIGKLLASFPLHITNITANVTENLFSGSVKLTIWGN